MGGLSKFSINVKHLLLKFNLRCQNSGFELKKRIEKRVNVFFQFNFSLSRLGSLSREDSCDEQNLRAFHIVHSLFIIMMYVHNIFSIKRLKAVK